MKSTKNLLFLLVLTFSVAALAAPTKKKTEKEYWEEITLGFNELKIVVNSKSCNSNETAYLSCFAAVSSLAKKTSKPASLVPETVYNNYISDYETVIAKYYPLVLVTEKSKAGPANKPINKIEEWKKFKKKEKEIQESLLSFALAGKRVNFEVVLSDLSKDSQFASKPQSYVAEALNQYFSVFYDPHTHINPEAQVQAQYDGEQDSVVGIGIRVRDFNNKILVAEVIQGGPAEKGGVKANDVIVKIDGVEVEKIGFEEGMSRIRGKPDTSVNIGLSRKSQIIEMTIVRKEVVFPNVLSRVIEDSGKKYGYVKLGTFMDKAACEGVSAAITKLQNVQVQGLIFDMRGNGGGRLDQAICIVGLFVGKGKVAVKVKDLNSNHFQDLKTQNDAVTALPMITLVDSGSASASEVVSGALQDYERSWVVGDRSFGKGTVQQGMSFLIMNGQFIFGAPVMDSEIIIYKTVQRFYQPKGTTNQMVGIIPEFYVPFKPNATEEELFTLREEDLFSNALVAVSTPPAPTRPDEIAKIKSCAGTLITQQAQSSVSMDVDYQLYNAGKIMTCSLQPHIPIKRH